MIDSNKTRILSVASLAAAIALCSAASGDGISVEEDGDGPDAVAMQAMYDDHLAENASITPTPTDEEIAAANFGCPDNMQFWMRDTLTPLCEPLCSSDADCAPDDGRCRVLDLNDLSAAPPMLLVDDMNPADVADILNDETKSIPPIQICDPFFDIVGATDAALVAE